MGCISRTKGGLNSKLHVVCYGDGKPLAMLWFRRPDIPVVVGGMSVASGDIIVADNDGVVVVSQSIIADVIGRLPAIRAAEADLESKVKAGLEIPRFLGDLIDSGRVLEVP